VSGRRELLSVALQHGNAFLRGFQAATLKPADFFGDDDVLYLMEDMATGEIRASILWEWLHSTSTRSARMARGSPRTSISPPASLLAPSSMPGSLIQRYTYGKFATYPALPPETERRVFRRHERASSAASGGDCPGCIPGETLPVATATWPSPAVSVMVTTYTPAAPATAQSMRVIRSQRMRRRRDTAIAMTTVFQKAP
jgi:hypothetical protein